MVSTSQCPYLKKFVNRVGKLRHFMLKADGWMKFFAVLLCLQLRESNDEYAEYLVHHETRVRWLLCHTGRLCFYHYLFVAGGVFDFLRGQFLCAWRSRFIPVFFVTSLAVHFADTGDFHAVMGRRA